MRTLPQILAHLTLFWHLSPVHADCGLEEPSLQEQFDLSPIVVRVIATDGLTQSLLCGIEIYDNDYIVQDSNFPTYAILEVFKQDWNATNVQVSLLPADKIPIIHDTDTGFYKDLPAQFTTDELGFLAFLYPYRTCNDDTAALPYETATENVLQNAYLFNECTTTNRAWSFVSDDDKLWLRSQQGHQAVPTVADDTTKPVVEPTNVTDTNSTMEDNDDGLIDLIPIMEPAQPIAEDETEVDTSTSTSDSGVEETAVTTSPSEEENSTTGASSNGSREVPVSSACQNWQISLASLLWIIYAFSS